MINKRLINLVGKSKKYLVINVMLQIFSLFANIVIIKTFIDIIFLQEQSKAVNGVLIIFISVIVKCFCTILSNKMSYLSSKSVKKILREIIYKKLVKIGASYNQNVKTSEVVQLAVEGVGQLESYFGAYLPQFFYAILAPIILFFVLAPFNFKAALILFISVPLIPISIAAVQTFAKKLLAKYWGRYTSLGDTFLENLQGMTTLKIYQSDEFKHKEMNAEAEKFRKITMKVLVMQLNSITIMDLVAYGGTALGIIISVLEFVKGGITSWTMIFTILISADFFLPMRLLGSFFHIAMNGMAAAEKIFILLDSVEPKKGNKNCPMNCNIELKGVSFSYDNERDVLHNIDMTIPKGSMVSIVGESGCGKTTITSLLTFRQRDYSGEIILSNDKVSSRLSEIDETSLMNSIAYIGFNSYLFQGTVRENLVIAKPDASEEEMWNVLSKAQLADFLRNENGLDTILQNGVSNLSGGQKQRLALARALLKNSEIYIFDEAASNIDVESENTIMKEIYALKGKKTIIFISHRLANVVKSDVIYVMENGAIIEAGTHKELLQKNAKYAQLWEIQQNLENAGVLNENKIAED